MSLNKDMTGYRASDEMRAAIDQLTLAFRNHGNILRNLSVKQIFERTKPIVSINNAQNFWQWAGKNPSRFGSEYPDRFDFWATSGRMDGVLFMNQLGNIGVPMWRKGDRVIFDFFNLSDGTLSRRTHDLRELMPLFPKAVLPTMSREQYGHFLVIQEKVAKFCEARDAWLAKAKPPQLNESEREALSELDADKPSFNGWDIKPQRMRTAKERHDDKQEALRAMADSIIAREMSKRETITGRWAGCTTKPFISSEDLRVDGDVIVKGTQKVELPKEKGKEDMNFKQAFVGTQKSALAQVSALQAGRASNKVIKEAMRPLVSSFFKPNFMQRIAMKLFGIQNPTDKFMASDASDMVCAQLAEIIVQVRGVEDENVRKVTEAGIVYAGNKLADNIPLEATIDSVVEKLVQGAGEVAGKIGK